ncbi:hypothetical protein [Bradyrhizobium sp.]|uniref:hypothetical protein n=1 Tax=Bradyrhizobium sp. TaxID=376 RepID=UPI0025C3F72A|nr:hypothetical protein [Bradyrhizobium sp.]
MRDLVMERASLTAKRDFDLLPRNAEIAVQPARRSDLGALADMANRLVPGVRITEPDLERYYTFDPSSILTFSRKSKLLGAVAFLYLNSRGHDALILDDISLTHPEIGLLAGSSEEVSAIYVWAIAGMGKAMAGLGNVSTHLSRQRLAPADLYAQPSSADGRNLMIAIGFEPVPSYQHELWRYQRPWNRVPLNVPTAQPARSFADARH